MVLTQTHPAAPYVCRTGNITLRCQYDGVENVLNVVWNVDDMVNLDFDAMTLPGHTALNWTDSHQDVVIASFAYLRKTCDSVVIQPGYITSSPRLIPGPVEGVYCYVPLYVCKLSNFRWKHWSLCFDLGKQDSHHFECHLVGVYPKCWLMWRLWGRETEQTDRGQRLWGTSLLKVRSVSFSYSMCIWLIWW